MTARNEPSQAASSPPRPRRGRWWRRGLIAAAVVAVVYTLFGFFGVPLLIRHVAVPRLARHCEGTITLAKARCNPLTLSLTLEGLQVTARDGRPVFSFDRFDGNFQLLESVFRSGYRFERAYLTRPHLELHVHEDRDLNLKKLVRTDLPKLGRVPRVVIAKMGMAEASLSFRDDALPEPFAAELNGVACTLDGFDTDPEVANPLVLDGRTGNGATFRWTGTLNVNPLSSRGRLKLVDVDLPQFMPYAMARVGGRVIAGRVSADLAYELDPIGPPRFATLDLEQAVIRDLNVTEGGEPWLATQELTVRTARVDADARSIDVGSIVVGDPVLTLARDASGEMRVTRIARGRSQPTGDEPTPADGRSSPRVDPRTLEDPVEQIATGVAQLLEDAFGAWSVAVRSAEVQGGEVAFLDQASRAPVHVVGSNVRLKAGPSASDSGWRTPIELALDVGDGGRVELDGTVALIERTLEVDMRGEGLELVVLAPYVPRELPDPIPAAELRKARLAVDGTLRLAFPSAGGADLSWTGGIDLDEVHVDRDGATRMIDLEGLRLAGEARVRREPTRALTASWEGTTSLRGFRIDAPVAGPVTGRAGELSADGRVTISQPPDAVAAVTFAGDATLNDVLLEAPETIVRRVTVGEGTITGASLDTEQRRISAQRAVVRAPDIVALIDMLPAAAVGAEAAAETPPAEVDGPYVLTVDELLVENGEVQLRDERADPPAVITAQELRLSAAGLSSAGGSTASVDLSSQLFETGRLEVGGGADLFGPQPSGDVEVRITQLPLEPLDPMAGAFAGYHIESGRMTLVLPVSLRQGQVEGTVEIDLDQIELGEKVDSPTAPDVPLELGLSLLRGPDGHVRTAIPISGDLADPEFSLSDAVWQAFSNVLVQAATAPFQLLGSLFDAGDQDLSFIEFEPGQASISDAELGKLDVLGRALKERPGLRLRVQGRLAPDVDEPALRMLLLRQAMLLRAGDEAIGEMSEDAYRRAIDRAYRELPGEARPATPATPTFEDKQRALAATMQVPPDRLVDLARARALAVVEALVVNEGVEEGRVHCDELAFEQARSDAPRAELELR